MIVSALEEITGALVGAGIRATTDPAALNPVGVLLELVALSPDLLHGLTLRCRAVLIAPDVSVPRALEALAELYPRAVAVLADYGAPGDATADTIALPGQPTPLPCLVLTFDISVSE